MLISQIFSFIFVKNGELSFLYLHRFIKYIQFSLQKSQHKTIIEMSFALRFKYLSFCSEMRHPFGVVHFAIVRQLFGIV